MKLTIQALAAEALSHFKWHAKEGTSNDGEMLLVESDESEWVRDIIRNCEYEQDEVHTCLSHIHDTCDKDDTEYDPNDHDSIEPDLYTADLLQWLNADI